MCPPEQNYIMRRPDSVPAGYTQPVKISQPNWLLNLISLVFLVAATVVVVLVSSGIIARVAVDPLIILGYSTRQSGYLVVLLLAVSLATFEIHEQLHRLFAKGLGLEPIYYRLKGHVVVRETWISRRELNLMTAAPIFMIQLPALLILIIASGTLGDIAELAFIMNAGFIAKDATDIIFHFRLPEETQFWMSDLGEETVGYFSAMYQNSD